MSDHRIVKKIKIAVAKATSKPEYLILACIIGIALFLRLYELGSVPSGLFIDEITASYTPYLYQNGLINSSISGVISYLITGTFFVYPWFGASSFFTRLPSVLFGSLLVLVIYLLAKEMFSTRVGLLSAALMAVCPWALHFSRLQYPSSAYVLYFTVALFFFYKGIRSENEMRKFVWHCFGSLFLGLTMYTHISAAVFVPLFMVGFLIATFRTKHLEVKLLLPKGFCVYAAIFLFVVSPFLFSHIFARSEVSTLALNYSTFSHSQNILDFFRMILDRAWMHLSPGFLVFTSPATHDLGFQETISQTGVLRTAPTNFGVLNYYGILVYPGILLLTYTAIKKKSKEYNVLLWWIICYLIASGTGYYDNPSSARNIVGLPALIITIALFADFLVKVAGSNQGKGMRRFIASKFISLILICLVAVPSGFFFYQYFVTYPPQSARVFDYGYKDVAQFLTESNNWERPILIYDDWNRNWNLAFYSPQQPVDPAKFVCIYPPFSLADLFLRSFTQVEKSINYEGGTIILEYGMRIDKSYGGASSAHVQLVRDEGNMLGLAVYANDSWYCPNGYGLGQRINGKLSVEERPLPKVIEYSKWYNVKLVVDDNTVLFYFDGELISTWPKLVNDAYSSIRFCGESAGVSFTDIKIKYDEEGEFVNILEEGNVAAWHIIFGSWTINRDILCGQVGNTVLIVPGRDESQLQLLSENNVEYEILKTIYYPTGDVALRVLLVPEK